MESSRGSIVKVPGAAVPSPVYPRPAAAAAATVLRISSPARTSASAPVPPPPPPPPPLVLLGSLEHKPTVQDWRTR